MAQKEVFLTPEGLEKLKAELEHLRSVRRQQVAEQIHRAKELGGTVDNAEYDDAKNEQAFVEGRILTLEKMIKNAILIEEEKSPSKWVKLGSKVTVRNQDGEEEHYTIVGSAEASPSDGRISNESPVGSALMGKRVGDAVEAQVPAGTLKLEVILIE
ncbi:MAG TPA: transcription elongation factor GreA [Dehalococcoidia bacterium]|nr:transcription elongation factor GreA [Dehalococcoidia bacterium]